MLAYGRQKPAYSHFVARIFRKILAEHLTHFIRKLLWRPGLFQSGARASCAMSQQMAAGKARVTVLSGRGPWVNPKKCGAPKGCAQGHAREPGAWLFCSSKDYGTGAVNPLDSLTAPAVSPPRLGEAALNPLNCFTIQHFFIFIQQGGYFCQFILRHLWIRKHGRAGCQ